MLNVYKKIALMGASLFIILFLLELGCAVFYRIQNGHFLYFRTDAEANKFETPDISKQQKNLAFKTILDPYLGFVDNYRANKFLIYKWDPAQSAGEKRIFPTASLTPYIKQNTDEIIIGILGGSLAELTLQDNNNSTALGAAIVGKLREDAFFQNKTLVFICLAHSAYKQPQQLISLSLALSRGQKFDYLVNIDGFNELALSLDNINRDFPYYFPSSMVMLPLINMLEGESDDYTYLRNLRQALTLKKELQEMREKTPSKFSSLVYYFEVVQQKITKAQLNKKIQAIIQNPANDVFFKRAELAKIQGPAETHYTAIIKFWANATQIMEILGKHSGAVYLHIIQPNQYYDLGRRYFSPEETEMAISPAPDYPHRLAIERGYPLLLAAAAKMAERGFPIFSATDIFLEVKEPVYRDVCCHLNERGQVVFSEFLAKTILEARKSRLK